jgi:hypothetical protein
MRMIGAAVSIFVGALLVGVVVALLLLRIAPTHSFCRQTGSGGYCDVATDGTWPAIALAVCVVSGICGALFLLRRGRASAAHQRSSNPRAGEMGGASRA